MQECVWRQPPGTASELEDAGGLGRDFVEEHELHVKRIGGRNGATHVGGTGGVASVGLLSIDTPSHSAEARPDPGRALGALIGEKRPILRLRASPSDERSVVVAGRPRSGSSIWCLSVKPRFGGEAWPPPIATALSVATRGVSSPRTFQGPPPRGVA